MERSAFRDHRVKGGSCGLRRCLLYTSNSQIGIKDRAQLLITNPQIINGGQTAYTLSCIYRENSRDLSVFDEKEVMVKVITFLDEQIDEKNRRSLIEELSRATNEQSPVTEADRRANDEIQIHYQEMIYKDFSYFYDRKRGEFFDGEEKHYIDGSQIVERSTFMRIAASVQGDVSKEMCIRDRLNTYAF